MPKEILALKMDARCEWTHEAVDAKEGEPPRSLTVQPDLHGLTIRFGGNKISRLVVSLRGGEFTARLVAEDEQKGAADESG